MTMTPETLDWDKGNGLIPAIVQDAETRHVLMLGYMNRQALQATYDTGRVTFFSRSRQALWTKGEQSGNYLNLVAAHADCDQDTLLITARPDGPACHTGTTTCFGEPDDVGGAAFLDKLDACIRDRNARRPTGSYTTKLFEKGRHKQAQKLGEEGVELALAAMEGDREPTLDESADLIYHMLVLLADCGISLNDVCARLEERHGGEDQDSRPST